MSSDLNSRVGQLQNNWLKNVKFEHLLAGTTGGVASTLVLHPLDLIKIRFQGLFFYLISFTLFFFIRIKSIRILRLKITKI